MVVFLPPIRSDLQLHCLEYNHFQYSNKPSYTHSHFPHCALNYALKGQPPSAGGTALGNDTHTTKLAPTGQKHFIDFGCYRWGESHSPCFHLKLETCISPPKLISFRATLKKCVKTLHRLEHASERGNFVEFYSYICHIMFRVNRKFVFLWQH